MTIFGKKQAGHQPQSKLAKRVASISTPELIRWAENSLFVIGKNLTHWENNRDEFLLEEAHVGAEALFAITTELKSRNER
jgi:hypothetical protein